jgi:RES domain
MRVLMELGSTAPLRSAWYATKTIQTAQAEVAYHQTVALSEVGKFKDEMTYDEYLADFAGQFHDLRISPKFATALDPASYKTSQTLAEELLECGSLGVVYPRVRHSRHLSSLFPTGSCYPRRKGRRFMFRWTGTPNPAIKPVRGYQK